MGSYLWKVTVVKQGPGKLAKGMNAEVVVTGSNGQPSIQQISDAINSKYGEVSSPSSIRNYVEIEKG